MSEVPVLAIIDAQGITRTQGCLQAAANEVCFVSIYFGTMEGQLHADIMDSACTEILD